MSALDKARAALEDCIEELTDAADEIDELCLTLSRETNTARIEYVITEARAALAALDAAPAPQPTEAEPVAWTNRAQIEAAKKGTAAVLWGKSDEFMDTPLYAHPASLPAPDGWDRAIELAAQLVEQRAGSIPFRQEIAGEIRAIPRPDEGTRQQEAG